MKPIARRVNLHEGTGLEPNWLLLGPDEPFGKSFTVEYLYSGKQVAEAVLKACEGDHPTDEKTAQALTKLRRLQSLLEAGRYVDTGRVIWTLIGAAQVIHRLLAALDREVSRRAELQAEWADEYSRRVAADRYPDGPQPPAPVLVDEEIFRLAALHAGDIGCITARSFARAVEAAALSKQPNVEAKRTVTARAKG